MALDKAFKKVP